MCEGKSLPMTTTRSFSGEHNFNVIQLFLKKKDSALDVINFLHLHVPFPQIGNKQ